MVFFLLGLGTVKFDLVILSLRAKTLNTRYGAQIVSPENFSVKVVVYSVKLFKKPQKLNALTNFLVAHPFRMWKVDECIGAGAYGKVR